MPGNDGDVVDIAATQTVAQTWAAQLRFIVFDRECVGVYPVYPLVWNSGIACGEHGNAKILSFDEEAYWYINDNFNKTKRRKNRKKIWAKIKGSLKKQ